MTTLILVQGTYLKEEKVMQVPDKMAYLFYIVLERFRNGENIRQFSWHFSADVTEKDGVEFSTCKNFCKFEHLSAGS